MNDTESVRPRRSDARRNRARLIDAARALFDEVGAEAASMNDIARRAGVGPGTLWRHFPDKEALTAEVVGESLDGLVDLAARLTAGPGHGDVLGEWLRALVRHVTRYRGLATRYARAAADGTGPLGTRCQAVEEAAAALVRHAHAHGQARADLTGAELVRLATALAWIGETTAPPATADDPATPAATDRTPAATDRTPAATDRLLDLLLDGLRPR